MTKKLPIVKVEKRKRKGRGYGSGKGGHTVGRGTKGQGSRSKVGVLFEGVKMKKSFVKRLPLSRGKGRFKGKGKPIVVKLAYLNVFPSSSNVDLEALIKMGIVKQKDVNDFGVKILGNGEIKKKLTILLPISNKAAKKIEKAGGKVIKEKLEVQRPKVKTKTQTVKKENKSGNVKK